MSSSDNSGNNNNGNNNGGNDTGGTGDTGGNGGNGGDGGNGNSLIDLTSGLKQLDSSGPPDLVFSPEARDNYLKIITDFQVALLTQYDAMRSMPPLGVPGCTLKSAIETTNNLNLDVSGLEGIVPAMNQYTEYLVEFYQLVRDAAYTIIGTDNGSSIPSYLPSYDSG